MNAKEKLRFQLYELRYKLFLHQIRGWFQNEAEAGDEGAQHWVDRIDGALNADGANFAGEITRALNIARQNGDLISEKEVERALHIVAATREP